MTTRRLRAGIVGCGGIARAHVAGYIAAGNVDVTAVYDISSEAATTLAEAIGPGAAVATTIEGVLSREVDLVSVCTPPGAHLESCLPFVEERVAVLCEKPLERDAERAIRLANAVHTANALFMTAFCHRFHPPVIELKRLIDSGVLGEPLFLRSIFSGLMELSGDHRSRPELSGGGSLIDLSSHSVDLFRHLIGEPTEVTCITANIGQDLPVEDFAAMVIGASGRAFGEIAASHSIPIGTNELAWYGTKGTAVVEYWDKLRYRAQDGGWVAVECAAKPDRFEREIAHFVGRVQDGAPPVVSVDDGLAASRVITAAYESAVAGRTVSVTPVTGGLID